jgi:hypothetical protein
MQAELHIHRSESDRGPKRNAELKHLCQVRFTGMSQACELPPMHVDDQRTKRSLWSMHMASSPRWRILRDRR